MNADLWQRLKPLYNAALDAPPENRQLLVDALCAGNPELAEELRALLKADSDAGRTLDSPYLPVSLLGDIRPEILPNGTRLARRFRIVRHLGSGGMGDVYEAHDEQMEEGRIALKTIQPTIARNALALARFKDEVRLARQVTGPNVCRIHELYLPDETDPSHSPAFLTMELLEGTTLHDRIADHSPMPLAEACDIAAQLCTALTCIHAAGIVHQDLKPRNVMLVQSNGAERVVVMDFGLARTAVASLSAQDGHNPGLIAGTPSYMAPEQFEGRSVGPATDIYALGLILYEMATGLQPYAAHTPLAAAIRRSKPPAHASAVRRDLPVAWDQVITRCLCYDPEERFATAADVHAALTRSRHFVLQLGKEHRLTLPKLPLFIAAIAAVCLLLFGAWWQFGRDRHPELSPDAARWYALGMTALREGSYLRATRMLSTVIERDPSYALAHAALADAWTELDFTANAQREMLLASAPESQKGLSDVERRYIDAVRTTLIRDYSAAAQDYEAILQKLPEESKAQGYVDLGRIYEKAGKVHETVASYETAARLNPDDPAPFLHLGILRSRLRDPAAANKAFDRAEFLYNAESDLGGLAEIAYQRGYAANEAAGTAAARGYLERALALARQIPSPQQEARSLSQLSTISYYSGHFDDAEHYAAQVTEIGNLNGLEYWTTDAAIRLGNTYAAEGKLDQANSLLLRALQEAKQNGHPRLEASANMSLSELRSQQARTKEQIAYSQAALQYYRDYGFLNMADRALVLIGRAQRDAGDYKSATATGEELVRTAEKTDSKQFLIFGHELLGTIAYYAQNYPQALNEFNESLSAAEAMKRYVTTQKVHCANLLWRLGRYSEAEDIISQITPEELKKPYVGHDVALIKAEMLRSRHQDSAAMHIAEADLKENGLETEDKIEVLGLLALTTAEQAMTTKAENYNNELSKLATQSLDPQTPPLVKSVSASVAVSAKQWPKAEELATEAVELHRKRGMKESEVFDLAVKARALMLMGKQQAAVAVSQQALDLLQTVRQSWGEAAFATYSARPDVDETIRELARTTEKDGANVHVSND